MVTDFESVPPLLVAVQVKVTPEVSVVTLLEPQPLWDVIADSLSVTVQLTDTSLVYQKLLPIVPLTFGVMTGAVVSQMRVTEAVAAAEEFPAASVETALMVFSPQESGTARRVNDGAVNVAAEPLTETLATPLVASLAVPLTSIVEAVVDDGRPPRATVGIVVSRLIVCVFDDVPPPLVAVQVRAVVPSVFTVVVVESVRHDAEREVIAESGSVTVKLTVMFPDLYQPFEPFGLAGVTTGVITGDVVSVGCVTVTFLLSVIVHEPPGGLFLVPVTVTATPAEPAVLNLTLTVALLAGPWMLAFDAVQAYV
jgi:hypothetical protein